MARRYANVWSDIAAELTAFSHTRASLIRWGVVIVLTSVWIVGGLIYWRAEPLTEAIYRTISAVGMWDSYFLKGEAPAGAGRAMLLEIVRFAAIAAPAVGLLFAFSGQLGQSLARIFNLGAAGHVVIAGESPAALSLALDCRRHFDAVILIAQRLAEETALGLRRKGVTVLQGDPAQIETLRAARANHAAHVVAFEPDDTLNLQIEAALRRLVGNAKRRRPISAHVATHTPMLLREAREMRSTQMRKAKPDSPSPVDPKPFSLHEMAARALIQQEAQTLLSLAAQLKQDRVHIVFFGFDSAAEMVASVVLKSLWSAHFAAPRLTVLAPDPAAAEAGFQARHREALAHPALWAADIAFMHFDWNTASVGAELLESVTGARGAPTALVVSTGADPENIHLSIALKRACNSGPRWPVPIYMRETSQSEFSQIYAKGDETAALDAYLQAFGAHQAIATRARIIDGALDRGAAIAHEHYHKGLGDKDTMSMRELQTAMKDWSAVLETYRAANRAVADSAMVKLWDAGWRPARKSAGEKGDTNPIVPPDLMSKMAEREHDRWVAERLMSGWRPGEVRNNDVMVHDKLTPWSALNEEDRAKDVTQVRAAIDIARVMKPNGFLPRAQA